MLFDFTQIMLFIVIAQMAIFSLFLFSIDRGKKTGNRILALLFGTKVLCVANVALETINPESLPVIVHFYFIAGAFTLLWAPLLYFYTLSLVTNNFRFNKADALHLLPFLADFIFVLTGYTILGTESKIEFLAAGSFGRLYFSLKSIFMMISIFTYTAASIHRVAAYRKNLKNNFSAIEKINLNWMLIVLGGFIIKWFFDFGFYIPNLIGLSDTADRFLNLSIITLFQPGKIGYLANEDSLSHFEKSKFWKAQAKNWVMENPVKWISLMPAKFAYLYLWDDWSYYVLLNQDKWNLYSVSKLVLKEKKSEEFFNSESTLFISTFALLYLFQYVLYFLLLGLIIYQFRYYVKGNLKHYFSKFREIYFFVFIGTCVTITSVGMARYKYHYVLLLVLTIVPIIVNYLNRKYSN